MVFRHAGPEPVALQRRDDDRGDVPTVGVATATGAAVALVPGDEEHAVVAVGRRAQYSRDHAAQPGVALAGRAVVHVVAHAGRDPDEVGDGAAVEVRPELGEGNHVRGAACGVVTDIGEVHEGVVLLRVARVGRAQVTRRGHVLHVRLPGPAAAFHLVCNVGCAHETAGAVAADTKGATCGQGQVLGKARVGDAVVVGRQPVAPGQGVDIRCSRVADDRVVLAVLHHDHEHVREVWQPSGGPWGCGPGGGPGGGRGRRMSYGRGRRLWRRGGRG